MNRKKILAFLGPTIYMTLGVAAATAIAFCTTPAHGFELEEGYLEAGFAPPHNEPDILKGGGDVARYAFSAGGRTRLFGPVSLEGRYRVWGVQPWRAPERVGSGLASWAGSDWSVGDTVGEATFGLDVALTGSLSLVTESRLSGSPRLPYYHMVKVRWRVR